MLHMKSFTPVETIRGYTTLRRFNTGDAPAVVSPLMVVM
jgi:hypothetical protein